jgi:hypothetical protein
MINFNFSRTVYTFSTTHECYLWTPAKTGSNHADFIFNYYDFGSLVIKKSDETVLFDPEQNVIMHSHQFNMLPEHATYKIICTARNPYTKLYSFYNHVKKLENMYQFGLTTFKGFVMNTDTNTEKYQEIQNILDNFFSEVTGPKIPDYFIRVENLYEDYLKIPFVSGSTLNTSGILQEICLKKLHVRLPELNINNYVDQELQEFISTKYDFYFDLLGYSKTL